MMDNLLPEEKLEKKSFGLKSKKELFWLLFFLLLALGVSSIYLLKDFGRENLEDELSRQYDEAESELASLMLNHDSLLRQQKNLENKRRDLLASLDLAGKRPDLLAELEEARLIGGQEEVSGSGLKIILRDKEGYDPLIDKPDALIHDGTITHLINLLNGAGARALSLNKIRITSLPQIYCIGPTILFYSRRLSPPYEILAIGPEEDLLEAVANDRYLQRITDVEIGVRMSIESGLQTIPSFSEYGDYRKFITLLEVTRSED